MRKIMLAMMAFCIILAAGVYAGISQPESGAEGKRKDVPARQIKVGDTLKISVWKYSDLDAALVVGGDGNINYSYVGDISAAGKTAEEVRQVITEQLDKNYIANPRVDVKIETNLATIFVVGEVVKPGSYGYEAGLDPLKAIAMAGGFTDFASNNVLIVRKDPNGTETQIKVNIKKLMKAAGDREKYQLLPGDMVVVKRSWF